ncbi:MAG: hybrid sensor histidine kinase/response regulator [Spirochaetales bacterium]|nr:hybrid sensor histidine kinase/response regulator [Spirochaetales bacterium]
MTNIRVLIVDDEAGMRLGAERILGDYRFQVPDFNEEISFITGVAENGKTAMALLENGDIDILLLDHKLPDMQGLDILKGIHESRKDIITIMITAYASIEVAIHATKNGAFDFLAKPFTPEELRITMRKAAEHIYLNRQAQALREEKRQIRFQFISVLAHELKSPLTALENYLFIMKDGVLGDKIAVYADIIERSIIRSKGMRRMICDLLDLTAIESGQKKRDLAPLNLCEQAAECLEEVRPDALKRGITIKTEMDEDIVITADREEMKIILLNLLTNAIKYNRENGTITLGLKNNSSNAIISCEDTGIGMTEEETKRLFGEFVRIKNEKTKHITGSGLGLSIVKKIVSLYGGTIAVDSLPDRGTGFTVTLPKENVLKKNTVNGDES